MTTSHTNPQPIRLYWSCTPAPVGMRMAWSARAIYMPSKCYPEAKFGDGEALEFLPDRQQFVDERGKELPDTEEHDQTTVFADCIDEVILPALARKLQERAPSGDSYDKIEISARDLVGYDPSYPWYLVATPNGSYGYMYVSVWLMPEEEIEDDKEDNNG